MTTFIQQFGILLIITVGISFLMKKLKQPLILGYVLGGVAFAFFLGRYNLGSAEIATWSELGITFLLFLMGLELDLKSLRYLGKDILLVIIPQTIFFFGASFFVSYLFGFSTVESIYLAILFSFSSTLLGAKWLEDKKETSSLHGKIILAILIVQDLLAIIALTALTVFKESSNSLVWTIPLKGLFLLLLAFLLARYFLNQPLRFASKYPELLFIFSLGLCFFFVVIAPLLGYSATIGAFIAGVTLANTIYKTDLASRVRPLIIFFNMLFFISLGLQIALPQGGKEWFFIIALTVLTFAVKPLVIYLTLVYRGYDARTSFLSGLSLAQVSEFGMIIAAAGVMSGAITPNIASLAVILVLVTMIISSYFLKYDHQLFRICEGMLRKFRFTAPKHLPIIAPQNYNILLFGYHEFGEGLFNKLKQLGKSIVVVENDPENIEMLKRDKTPYIYSSIHNPDLFEHLDLKKVELAVSSHQDLDANKIILQKMKKSNPKSAVIVRARNLRESLDLYKHKADYVLCPTYVNDQHVSVLMEDYTTDVSKVIAKKVEDLTRFRQLEEKRRQSAQKQSILWDIDSFFGLLDGTKR